MSDFEETWNADMRAALSGLLVEESLFSALNETVLDYNEKHRYWTDDEKMRRVQKAFAYADLCAKERQRLQRFEDRINLMELPIEATLMWKFKNWFVRFVDLSHFTAAFQFLVLCGVSRNTASFIEIKTEQRLSSLRELNRDCAEHFGV